MLSDEEREAIDYLQLCYDLSTITNESLSKLGIILNLIEKQSKEIERLKIALDLKCNKLQCKNMPDNIEMILMYKNDFDRNFGNDYVSKDKIKAKIEESKKDLKEYENGQEWEIQDEIRGQIEVLQSLLEKE